MSEWNASFSTHCDAKLLLVSQLQNSFDEFTWNLLCFIVISIIEWNYLLEIIFFSPFFIPFQSINISKENEWNFNDRFFFWRNICNLYFSFGISFLSRSREFLKWINKKWRKFHWKKLQLGRQHSINRHDPIANSFAVKIHRNEKWSNRWTTVEKQKEQNKQKTSTTQTNFRWVDCSAEIECRISTIGIRQEANCIESIEMRLVSVRLSLIIKWGNSLCSFPIL